MYRIALVNMPCAAAHMPSLALTQLKAVVEAESEGRAKAEIFYLNLDFARYLGPQAYSVLSDSVEANTAGLGDWFFREAAFPELADNTSAYLSRHFASDRQRLKMLHQLAARKRKGVARFLDQLIERYDLASYPLVGFTSMFSQNVACFAMARKLKEQNPRAVTVLGGANCEPPMGQVIARNVEAVDFVFSGASLKAFPELVGHLVMGERDKCHEIRGVYSRQKLASMPADKAHEIGEELDIDADVPVDYDDFFAALEEKHLNGVVAPKVPFETSRGCWWGERSHCTFCGLNGSTMTYRAMKPRRALDQFERLFDKYGGKVIEFQCVDNILPRQYFAEVLPYLKAPSDARIFYEIKADIKEHEAKLLADSGVIRLQPGIEALATSTLKLMKKGTTSFQNIKFLKYCLVYGIDPVWNLLIGFPGETAEVYDKYFEDLPKLVHLPPPTGVYPVRFDRFSPYHVRAEQYGLKLEPSDFYGMVYPFPEDDFKEMAYYFNDKNYGARYMVDAATALGKLRQRLDVWHSCWSEADRRSKPELRFQENGGARTIYDTRSGSAVEHEIGEDGLRVLDALSSQIGLSQLAKKLPEMPEAELERQIGCLEERNLVFRDGDLYMHLLL